MQKRNINIPDGTRDMLYDEAVLENEVRYRLENVYLREDFSRVTTPTLEYYDAFNFAGQPLPQEGMYKLTDNAGRLLVLRPDCTTPIARIAATKLKDARLPIKLSYSQSVYRIKSGYSGKRSEIVQSGVELIGLDGVKSDMMCITTAIKALETLDAEFKIELGHVGFYNALIAELALDEAEQAVVRDYVDSKNAVSLGFIRETAGIEKIMQIPLLFGGKEVFARAERLAGENAGACAALACVRKIYDLLEEAGYGERVLVDLGIVHKLGYYTGIVFRGFIEGAGEPVLGGGRYNNLVRNFGRDVPATGFAINVGAVSETLLKSGRINCDPPRVNCILFFDAEHYAQAEKLRRRCEAEGKLAELSCFETLEETRAYARSRGIPELLTLGADGVESEELR